MENFKLDLTQLTPVAEADRIKGNWYVVCDHIDHPCSLSIRRWHSQKYDMNQGGGCSTYFVYWFAIPPNLPGFPKSELPDKFELKVGEWEYYNTYTRCWEKSTGAIYRRIKHLPKLTIPSGTKSEQIEAVRKILEELETK